MNDLDDMQCRGSLGAKSLAKNSALFRFHLHRSDKFPLSGSGREDAEDVAFGSAHPVRLEGSKSPPDEAPLPLDPPAPAFLPSSQCGLIYGHVCMGFL